MPAGSTGSCSRSRSGCRTRGRPSVESVCTRSPGARSTGICSIAESTTARRGTARTRRTARDAPCRSGPTGSPSPSKSEDARPLASRPGRRAPRPPVSGRPPRRSRLTDVGDRRRVVGGRRDRAPPPPRRPGRAGRPPAGDAAPMSAPRDDPRPRRPRLPRRPAGHRPGRRRRRPRGRRATENGISERRQDQRPRPASDAARSPCRSPAAERRPTSSAFTATTRNVTPHTPATVASRRRARSSTWETPSVPQLNPPSGHAARTHRRHGPQRGERRPRPAADVRADGPPGRQAEHDRRARRRAA